LFQTFYLGIFFFSSTRKKKQKRKNAEIGGKFPSRSYFALLFLPFHFKHFLLSTFFFSSGRKEKKTIKKKKMQRKEGTYLSSLAFAFGMKCSSCFLLSTFLQC
jgi:hypothetical protein